MDMYIYIQVKVQFCTDCHHCHHHYHDQNKFGMLIIAVIIHVFIRNTTQQEYE